MPTKKRTARRPRVDKDRQETKFLVGLSIVLFGPSYASHLDQQARASVDARQREFYTGAARIVRGAVNDPRAATDALEALWDSIFGR